MSWLGTVVRPYDHPNWSRMADAATYVVKPLHRHDDHVAYMRPDDAGTLEVIASCQVHFVRVPKADVWNGVEAPCPQACDE
jgi:hypothetical protein